MLGFINSFIPKQDRAWKIPLFPTLDWLDFKLEKAPVFPYSEANCLMSYNAREALKQGLVLSDLKPGDPVLMPVYACGTEINILLEYGLKPVWYGLNSDLSINFTELKKTLPPDTRGFFFIHYFGFPHPSLNEIIKFSHQHGLISIEDNAHGLYSATQSGKSLGSFGDFSIFSLYKMLATPDGGALMMNNGSDYSQKARTFSPGLFSVITDSRMLLERTFARPMSKLVFLLSRFFLDPASRLAKSAISLIKNKKNNPISTPHEAVQAPSSIPFCRKDTSRITKWLIARQDHKKIVDRRRKNYQYLLDKLVPGGRAKIFIKSLPEHCCPLFFPVLQTEGGRSLRSYMARHGIETHGFGFENQAIPKDKFPWEADLKYKLACLPIHQNLDISEMDKIADLVNQWSQDSSLQ